MSRNSASCLVSVTQSSGVELNVHLVLDEKPSRQDQKLKTLSQYVQQYASGWKKRLELANLLSAKGYWEQAVTEYRQIVERQPQLIDVWLKLGKLLQLMGRKAEAIEVYQSARGSGSNQVIEQHITGLIATCQGDTKKAILAFETAANLEPNNAAHWLALGQLQIGRENPLAALRAFDEILSLNPNDIVALIHSYDALMAVGNIPQAQQQLDKLILLAADDLRVLQRHLDQRCQIKLVSGEQGKLTKKMMSAALQQAPNAADVHKSLAYYHIFRGDWAQGIKVLAEFTEKYPYNPNGWYHYGRCLFDTGEYQAAAEVMLKVYRLYPDDWEIYRALCEILPLSLTPPLARGAGEDLQMAEEDNLFLASLVEEMLERFPERWSVWATAGRLLVESFQEIKRGCSLSLRGTQLQPQLADAWFCHGRVLALAGKHQKAVTALEKGWQLLPETGGYRQSVSAAVWLGESYQALGNDRSSRQWWEEACQGSEKFRLFHPVMADYWQGRALEGLGDALGAIELYRNALTQQLLYPVRDEVKHRIKRLRAKLRKRSRP
ncbi:tetratricopeptide repeat protein [Floridanema aerugineum]|uniref:Tetratricopeptide repeat protein n=1 Tax=Floridaenema aerugineum BLCC-F46 TaxID=3153654 RepID=A0ABV4XFV3_9CYAN